MFLYFINFLCIISLSCSTNLTQKQVKLYTALFMAVETNNIELLNQVLEYKKFINLDIKNKHNNSPLLIACQKNYLIPALCLIRNGSDINTYNINSGNTALIEATKNGCSPIVYKLLKQPNIDINACNNCGDTALHIAVEKNLQVIIDMLLEKKIDTSIKNVRNLTALDLATLLQNRDVQYMIINNRWKK